MVYPNTTLFSLSQYNLIADNSKSRERDEWQKERLALLCGRPRLFSEEFRRRLSQLSILWIHFISHAPINLSRCAARQEKFHLWAKRTCTSLFLSLSSSWLTRSLTHIRARRRGSSVTTRWFSRNRCGEFKTCILLSVALWLRVLLCVHGCA